MILDGFLAYISGLEEHNIVGGLASAIYEVRMNNSFYSKNIIQMRLDDKYSAIVESILLKLENSVS